MHVSRRSLAVLAAFGGLACAPTAQADQDHKVTVTPTDTTKTITGATASGFNSGWLLTELPKAGSKAPAPTCGKDPNTMCESTLVHVTADGIGSGTVTFRLDGFQQYSDFDLKSYESNAAGEPVHSLGSPTAYDPTATTPLPVDALQSSAGDYETKMVSLDSYLDGAGGPLDAYFLIDIPYFMVANDSYQLHVTLATEPYVPAEEQ